MSKLTAETEEKLMAQLAIQLGHSKVSPVGSIPDEEELAAMADHSLDDTRRAQVISHLANDAALYQKWVNIVQVLAVMNEVPAQQEKTSQNKSMLQTISAWFFGTKLRTSAFGGGFATAAVAFVVFILLPALNPLASIDDDYDQWLPVIESQWSAISHEKRYAKQSSASRAFQFKTPTQRIFEHGYYSGAKVLGLKRYRSLGISLSSKFGQRPKKPKSLTDEHYNMLVILGRLTALTTLQCEMPAAKPRYAKIHEGTLYISQRLASLKDEKIVQLVGAIPVTGSRKKAVCNFTQDIVKLVF